jgi:hypothetical protein
MPSINLFGLSARLVVTGGFWNYNSIAPDYYQGLDLSTGLPIPALIPAVSPPSGGTALSDLGTPGEFPLKLTGSALCYMWYKGKHWTYTSPSGTATIDFSEFLDSTTGYKFQSDTATMFFPMSIPYADGSAPLDVLELTQDPPIFSDGAGGFYPGVELSDSPDGVNEFGLGAGDGSGGYNFYVKTLAGVQIAKCPIQQIGGTGASFGDATMQCDVEW